MTAEEFVLDLSQIPPGGSRHGADLSFRVVDAAEEIQPFEVRIELKVDNLGKRFYVEADIQGAAQSTCHRCLKQFSRAVQSRTEWVFQLGDESRDEGDEVILVEESHPQVDLASHVQEALLLEEPIRILCAEDCRGLCSLCGQDLNQASCSCRPPGDPRWEALKALTDRFEKP